MYQHGYQDLDGHIWELFYMDTSSLGKKAVVAFFPLAASAATLLRLAKSRPMSQ